MESALSPREIQTRIRSGESLEDVAKVAGIPLDRVERFAAPVIAEREYVAGQAVASSVRRRGETSGHRKLRISVTERLLGRGVDVDTLEWDSYRMEDGRWGVTANYRLGDSERQALFIFDVQARFSVAGNDDARWLVGEQPSARGGQPRSRESIGEPSDDDVEPTVDLSDDLAIVRAVQGPPSAPPQARAEAERLAEVAEVAEVLAPGLAEESATAYPGLSDASAVPESATARGAGWEPAIVVNYPVEPSQIEPPDEFGEELHGTDEPGRPDSPTGVEDREDEAEALEEEQDEHRDATETTDAGAPRTEDLTVAEPEPADPTEPAQPAEAAGPTDVTPPAKPSRRKRASVPSWDEIMFGSPKRP